MNDLNQKIESVLCGVLRPGRYAGNEIHRVRKKWTDAELRFVLAFPDTYEIGMSHLGLGILYHVLNREPWILAERTFSPWVDMEEAMRAHRIPLFSIESRQPVKRFDILGISLQYELQYTNVLNLIDLAGIPLFSRDREETDPVVIAGGPCAFNPEPLHAFLDAVALGDGETVVLEIAETARRAKKNHQERKDLLRALASIPGVYVPILYQPPEQGGKKAAPGGEARPENEIQFSGEPPRETALPSGSGGTGMPEYGLVPTEEGLPPRITGRIEERLAPSIYPEKPLVPLIEVTHDRLSLEIMRGCTRGCRFCSAGMIYRPVRARPANEILRQAVESIDATGYEEISLVSLSTSDYPELEPLLSGLKSAFHQRDISISFPSLRPDTFTDDMADYAMGLRRSGLTLAPEAGTQRLRDVINKNNTEDDLLRAMNLAWERGWRRIKLYFMIGLPTESMEDVQGIVDLVKKVVAAGRKFGKNEVHVSISPFSPKPHTPFQWEAQDDTGTMMNKIRRIREGLPHKEVELSWRDPSVSLLETAMGRGGRELSDVIYQAWKAGARFDAWSDQFKMALWTQSFEACGLSLDRYAGAKGREETLPWSHLDKGVTTRYLWEEREKALEGKTTPDCADGGCSGCGLARNPACRERVTANRDGLPRQSRPKSFQRRKVRTEAEPQVARCYRLAYKKEAAGRFTSHLETIRIFERALRRAKIAVAVTQGFHAHSRISSGPPLSLGYAGDAEYLDIYTDGQVPREFIRIINKQLPSGIEVTAFQPVFGKAASLNSVITLASYRVSWDSLPGQAEMAACADAFLRKNSAMVVRQRKDGVKRIDIRPYVSGISFAPEYLQVDLRLTPDGTARLEEVIQACLPPDASWTCPPGVRRVGLYIEKHGKRITPLEILNEENKEQ